MKEKRIKTKEVRPRLSPSLHGELKKTAKREKRSINKQVELYIEEGLRRDGYQIEGGVSAQTPDAKSSGTQGSQGDQLRGRP